MGLSTNNLINEIKKYIEERKNKSVIITTALVGYKENDWHILLIKCIELLIIY